MGTEIERKFLVASVPAPVGGQEGTTIRQGYLATDGPAEVRLRDDDGELSLTVKSQGTLSRTEVDLALDAEAFAALWPLTEGARVEKRRIRAPLPGGLLAEVDVFGGALTGLVVVEVEFGDASAAEAFAPPSWFGEEVTTDPRFKNKALARAPGPPST